ncbi:hypothetical protein [Streptomyces sp. NPDC088400]|uniref:hypothetical protein n=1 Tax=Streptomyces sp. NPDC088400 TaxID=3365861 RepID=UPI0038211D9F
MPDRRRRTALHLPPPSGPVLLPRERQSSSTGSTGPSDPDSSDTSSGPSGSSSGSSGSSGSSDDNPFAPPPEGRPDQPWQPRHPGNGGSSDNGSGSGSDSDSGSDRGGWGSQWSSRQPGRSSGGFGSRPGGQNGKNEQGNKQDSGQDGPDGGRGSALRWDPTDPAQRRARYALLSGMWAFFFALYDLPEIALLLGSLALYWSISSLRARSGKRPSGTGPDHALSGGTAAAPQEQRSPAPGQVQGQGSGPAKQQTTAAVSGLVAASLALVMVAATFTVQVVYRDYYTCVNDSLTKTGQLSCNDLLPRSLVPFFGVKE